MKKFFLSLFVDFHELNIQHAQHCYYSQLWMNAEYVLYRLRLLFHGFYKSCTNRKVEYWINIFRGTVQSLTKIKNPYVYFFIYNIQLKTL